MGTSNYDPKTEDNIFNNDTTFSKKRFGELVAKVNELEAKTEESPAGSPLDDAAMVNVLAHFLWRIEFARAAASGEEREIACGYANEIVESFLENPHAFDGVSPIQDCSKYAV